MCGIVYNADFTGKPVNNRVLDQFFKQKSRGVDGFGLYDRENRRFMRTPKQRKILSYVRRHPSTEILFHHRWPTSTDNVTSACHPFSTRRRFDTNYVLVHNGIISNSRELKQAHEQLGITYQSVQPNGSFNDSEALLWDVALYLEGKQDVLKAAGSIAFICMALSDSDTLYFARNYNPLNMNLKAGVKLSLSSEGKGELIDTDTLYQFNYDTHEVTKTSLIVPTGYSAYNSGYYHGYNYPRNPDFDWYETTEDNEYLASSTRDDDFEDDFDDAVSPVIDAAALRWSSNRDVIQRDIKTRMANYLKWNNGQYRDAYDMCLEDMGWLKRALMQTKIESDDDTDLRDLEYEIEVQQAVMGLLYSDPSWDEQIDFEQDALYGRPLETRTVQEIIAQKVLEAKHE